MCAGLAIERRNVPDHLIEKYRLQDRITSRGGAGEQEVHFLFRAKVPLLPVWHERNLDIYIWGNRDDRFSRLPKTGWCRMESIAEGKWEGFGGVKVEIPCSYGLEKGVWFQVVEGLKGILVRDEKARPHVYILTQPASHYYNVMTRHDRMPVFLGRGY